MIEVFFLGTGAAIPSRERGHTTQVLRHKGELLLFDCGENTQRRIIQEDLSLMKISKIFVTHLHADHFAGLLALPQSLYLLNRAKPLEVFGPKGIKEIGEEIKRMTGFDLGYDLVFKEIPQDENHLVYQTEEYEIRSTPVKHGVETVAYCFQEKPRRKFLESKADKYGIKPGPVRGKLVAGKDVILKGQRIKADDVTKLVKGRKIVFSGDTLPLQIITEFSKGADLLIHEATYADDKTKEAEAYCHTTARQAAKVAKDAKVKSLILTHISPRYKDAKILADEAKEAFSKARIAKDGMKVVIK